MIGSDAYNYINVLNKAAGASWTKNEIIANNIANVDTPDYKRRDLNFESLLSEALSDNSTYTKNMDKKVANINLASLKPRIYTEYSNLSYRYDGNNVDIDTEQAYLADNQIKYYTLLDSMTHEFNRLKSVLNQ
ncbi:MAG: flagellar basal body rod protein FlgB [Lachnospiraceae bacterium]|nr:flagellar basal body rod protein FlgB [Lachnospiraceae bacterium]